MPLLRRGSQQNPSSIRRSLETPHLCANHLKNCHAPQPPTSNAWIQGGPEAQQPHPKAPTKAAAVAIGEDPKSNHIRPCHKRFREPGTTITKHHHLVSAVSPLVGTPRVRRVAEEAFLSPHSRCEPRQPAACFLSSIWAPSGRECRRRHLRTRPRQSARRPVGWAGPQLLPQSQHHLHHLI